MALEDGTNNDGEAVGSGNNARLAMLAKINDANDAAHADDYASINDDGTTEKFTVQQDDGTQVQLTDDTVADPEADAAIEALARESDTAPPAPQMITRKVNGREVTKSLDDWLVTASKVEAADNYLAEASRLRQEQIQKAQASVVADPAPDTVDDDLAFARALQMGSEEEAAAAVRALRRGSPSVSTADIAKTIDDRLTFNQAIQQYRKDYADIVGDPILNNLAQETDAKLIAAGDTRPYDVRYKDIGDSLRAWVAKKTQAAAPPVVQPVDKLARKQAATPAPKPASQKTVSLVEPEVEESMSDIIAGIAKSRGGPQWMAGSPTQH